MSRVGLGFDAHAVDRHRALVLGGVEIPGGPGLAGHSDADVLSHALADALLGAAGAGDLGAHFPSDERWAGASSLEILAATVAMVAAAGFTICNVDVTVIAQAPPIAPHRLAIVERLADALGLSADAVSIKATTTDHLGFTGRGEGMAALAIVALEPA